MFYINLLLKEIILTILIEETNILRENIKLNLEEFSLLGQVYIAQISLQLI